jgi:hypothetical protein
VFVDIDHRYESTVAHLALLASHVRPGGWLVFDDINYSDEMRRAWIEVQQHPGFAWTTLRWRHRAAAEPRMGLGRRLAEGSPAPAAVS